VTEPAVISTVAGRRDWRFIARLLIIVALIVPRCLAYSYAGGLWRDEVHSVDMANFSSSELFFALTNDSFPICWQVILRTWIALFGNSDESVRLLGTLIGIAVIPAMWWTARQFGVAFPWWMMVLLGLDPSLIVFGGEVRGYGLGIITLLILIGTAWRTLEKPTVFQWFGLTLAALLAVQSSFTNCSLLAATFIACGFVALYRSRYRSCLGFALVGMLAATSMIPYVLYVFPGMSVAKSLFGQVSWTGPMLVFNEAYLWGGTTRAVLGRALVLIGLLIPLHRLIVRPGNSLEQTVDSQNLALFVPLFFLLGTTAVWSYLLMLGVSTQYWYHLPWLTILALTAELGTELWSRWQPQRQFLIAGIGIVACVLIFRDVAPRVRYQMTTIDSIAHDLGRVVREGDLVVVTPWYIGISFDHYYHGSAEWMNLPDVNRDRRHLGYRELIGRVMPLPPPVAIRDELEKIEQVLVAGNRVWWVTAIEVSPEGAPPLVLVGAPDPRYGWSEWAYGSAWQQLAFAHMQAAGATMQIRTAPRSTLVNPHENPYVYVFEPSKVLRL